MHLLFWRLAQGKGRRAFTLFHPEYFNIVKVQIDSTLQTVLMLGFFTTIGLMASLRVVKDGGRLLLGFLLAVTVLVFLQNGMGMAIAEAMGFDKHYGILAGSVSMMGGLGTAAAFGPYFEETYGITGGTAVAVTAATFGMVAALLIGGPFGEWCIRRYQVKTPDEVQQPEPELHLPDDMDTDITEQHASAKPNFTNEIMRAVSVTALAMGLGTIVSNYLGHYITLPAYIGAMIVATVIRNVGDFSGMYKVEGKGLNAVADITLVLFVTMAINNLKLHELVHLALPLVVILACQTILMLIYAWTVLFTAAPTTPSCSPWAASASPWVLRPTVLPTCRPSAKSTARPRAPGSSSRSWAHSSST